MGLKQICKPNMHLFSLGKYTDISEIQNNCLHIKFYDVFGFTLCSALLHEKSSKIQYKYT